MDKNKLLATQGAIKRSGKNKAPLPSSSNLYALGTLGPSTSTGMPASSAPAPSSMVAKTVVKRENQPPPLPNAVAKKLKLLQASSSNTKTMPLTTSSILGPISGNQWDEKAQEVEPGELVKLVQEAVQTGKTQQAVAMICGAVKQLRASRSKPESALYLSIIYLVKNQTALFRENEVLVDAFTGLLRKDGLNPKNKINPTCHILAANILLAAFADESEWPSQFIKVYVEDALGDRLWVDHELCKCFVDNILTAFNTRLPSRQLLSDQLVSVGPNLGIKNESPASASPSHPSNASGSLSTTGDDSQDSSRQSNPSISLAELREKLADDEHSVRDRYAHCAELMSEDVINILNEHLNRRQLPAEISKHLLKLLISCAGLPKVRTQVAQRIEIWLQNPKLGRTAQDLFAAIWVNCGERDIETIACLLRLRLKSKPLVNHFIASVRELITQEPRLVPLILRCAVNNELSQTRSGNNMQLLAMLFQVEPSVATSSLASHIIYLLVKDDNIKQVRQLLRELVRALRHELNLCLLVSNLTKWSEHYAEIDSLDFGIRERICSSIADLIVLCMFLSVSPTVKEAHSASRNDPKRETIRQFYNQLAEIQKLGVSWLHFGLNRLFTPDRIEFINWLNKILLMENAEAYCSKDNWPPEQERPLIFRLTTDIPVVEETLNRLISMGFSKDHHLQSTEAIELVDTLIRRAASLYDGSLPGSLVLQKDKIFELLLKSTTYRVPENIQLPTNYDPPEMAIADWYWKVWLQLLILVSHNAQTIGRLVADGAYPTLSMLIEMVITNHYEYPPASRPQEEWRFYDQQCIANEKQLILQFESHLAAASTKMQINETNSLLLTKLISYDPNGQARRPPPAVLDQLRALNSQLKLGHLLCQSRNPDFLLQIIQRQQSGQANGIAGGTAGAAVVGNSAQQQQQCMPWLTELVEMNSDSFSQLPCQCLCEFVLGQFSEAEEQGLLSTPAPITASANLVSQLTNGTVSNQHTNVPTLSNQERARRKEKRRKLVKLIVHLQHLLKNDAKAAEELLTYFMKRLSFPQAGFRTLAVRVLGTLFTFQGNVSAVWEEDSQGNWPFAANISCNDWLLIRTPQMPHFAQLKPLICESLLDAILVEALPQLVCCYIQFLSIHEPSADRRLARCLARLLIERPIMTKCLTQGEFREPFLSACAKLFFTHMMQAIELGLTDISRTSGDDALTKEEKFDPNDTLVLCWSPQKKALLNTRVAQAMMLLLAFGPTADERLLYEDLLQMWFNPTPEATSITGHCRMSVFVPDWLKLRLIRSSIPSLVDCALRDLDINQLLLFIQTFGIPIVSMEKLLSALDTTCRQDPDSVRQSIGNPGLLKQLIEVQFSRGVKSGYAFAELIGIH